MTLFDSLRCLFHQAAPHRKHATPVPSGDRRRRPCQPAVEALEARLPLGDGVLGGLVGWWLGSSLMPLEIQLRASDGPLSSAWMASDPITQSSSVERLPGYSRPVLAHVAESLSTPVEHFESGASNGWTSWDTLPVWQPYQPMMERLRYVTTPVAPTSFALSLSSAGGTVVPLAVAASGSNFQPSSAPGGTRLSTPALLGSPAVSPSAASPRLHDFGRTPLSFEANHGQTAAQVQYLAHGPGYTVFLTSTEAVLALRPGQPTSDRSALASLPGQKTGLVGSTLSPAGGKADSSAGAVVRMQLLGGNPAAQASGGQRLPGIVNYFRGNDPSQWHTRIPTYAQVQYHDVYPGIGLVYYGNQQQLEYDFQVAPGADPAQIHLGFAGAQNVSVNSAGELVVQAGGQVLRQHAPVVYQEVAGQRRQVAAGFVVQGGQVGFALGGYDRSRPLVIDPVLSYATYLGGSSDDRSRDLSVDTAGNAYVTGSTWSPDFPIVNALQQVFDGDGDNNDAFVAKLAADGSGLLFCTYLGGSARDQGNGIAVDAAGNVYVAGSVESRDFPMAGPLQPSIGGDTDAFVAELTADGSALVYSTYLGGRDTDYAVDIALDAAGSAYVTGTTGSRNFPTTAYFGPAGGGAFITKFNPTGSALVYSTILGGGTGYGIGVDAAGNAYVTGTTRSPDFPIVNALQPALRDRLNGDAFVSKLTADGSALVYSTYFGGGAQEEGRGIAVDLVGNAYITGFTGSPDFPTANALQPILGGGNSDAFVAELTADGSALVYSTYLGGSGYDGGIAIAIDAAGNAYATGWTASQDFPTANPLQPMLGGGNVDAFVAELTADDSALVYSTYLGGSGGGYEMGMAIAIDATGNAYVAGETTSLDFPVANALQPIFGGGYTADFVAKISP